MTAKLTLTPEKIELARQYLTEFEPGSESELREEVPTRAGLSLYIDVKKRTLEYWMQQVRESDDDDVTPETAIKRELFELIESMDCRKEVALINGGLRKEFDSRITNLLLNGIGYREEKAIDHKSTDGSMTPKTFSPEDYKKAQSQLSDEMDGLD